MSWFGRWGEARRSKYEIRETKLEKISGQGEINQDGRAKPRYCNPRARLYRASTGREEGIEATAAAGWLCPTRAKGVIEQGER